MKDVETTTESNDTDGKHDQEVLHIVNDLNDHSDQSRCGLKHSQEVEHLNPENNETNRGYGSVDGVRYWESIKQHDYQTECVTEKISQIPEGWEVVCWVLYELLEFHIKEITENTNQ